VLGVLYRSDVGGEERVLFRPGVDCGCRRPSLLLSSRMQSYFLGGVHGATFKDTDVERSRILKNTSGYAKIFLQSHDKYVTANSLTELTITDRGGGNTIYLTTWIEYAGRIFAAHEDRLATLQDRGLSTSVLITA
jgi:hypothetical protein